MTLLRNTYFAKLGKQVFSRFSTTRLLAQDTTNNSTIDQADINNFAKSHNDWWNPNGKFGPLHSMNPLRIKLIRDGLINVGYKDVSPAFPFEGLKILDVGCGGGILSEPLARLGAEVTGLDATKELIYIAKEHAALDKGLSSKLTFVHSAIEDFSQDKIEQYDVVIASEIIEHVINQELFLKHCIDVLKPKGSIFITTFNKNLISWFSAIILAEYLCRVIPQGTHDWNKFIPPEETIKLLDKFNCKTKLLHGVMYNPVCNNWIWTPSTVVSYALHAVKQETTKNNI